MTSRRGVVFYGAKENFSKASKSKGRQEKRWDYTHTNGRK